jgi:hypothetical protein
VTVANPYDVAARLAEGRPVIDDVEEYLAACRQLGYQHAELTARSAQVRDWYAGEEGMDLRVLDTDHAALSVAASAAEDAARLQTDLVAELSAAWSGRGAVAAREFVWRSSQAATAVGVAVRTAADAVATLRDALWQAVDAKVLATEAVDAAQQQQRTEWLAATKTVTSGAGDLAAASELIELQVKPFVDLDVGSRWVAAMRAANSAIDAAYGAAIAGTTTAPPAVFGVPGELGPRAESSGHPWPRGGRDTTAAPVPTSPAAAVGSAPAPAAPVVAPPAVAPAAAPASLAEAAPLPPTPAPLAAPPAMPSMPSAPSLGDLGAVASTPGSGLSGFGQQLADLIGGLVGSADGGLSDADDTSEPDEPDADLDTKTDDPVADEADGKVDEAEEVAESEAQPAEEVADEPVPEQSAPLAEPVPAPIPEPEPTPAPLPPEPPAAPQATPCEIAADELPQVGE